MQHIDSIKITSITLTGFRCFGETQGFSCGDMTIITGANGVGKSSIADAIAYAFCGMGFFGESKIDRLQNPNYDGMEALVSFADDFGELHKLYRGHRAGKTSLMLDGTPIIQAALSEMIGDKDLFLSIFNPLYFVEVLGNKGRGLLEPFMACVPEDAIFAALDGQTAALLTGESLPCPDTYIKARREEIRELERDLIYMEGKRDYAVDKFAKCFEQLSAAEPPFKDAMIAMIDYLLFEGKEIQVEPIQEAIDGKKRLVAAAQAYVGKKYELLFQNAAQSQGVVSNQNASQSHPLSMNRVSLSLTEIVKTTGEIKDDFKFLYEGRPYIGLSLSEKIRAGLEITEMIKRLTGKNYPVFIDNMESICVIDNMRPTGQTFCSRVVKGEALQVVGRANSVHSAAGAGNSAPVTNNNNTSAERAA